MNRSKEKIKAQIKNEFHGSPDLVDQKLEAYGNVCELCYISSVSDSEKIQRDLYIPFFELRHKEGYENHLLSLAGIRQVEEKDQPEELLLRGSVLIFFNNLILRLDVKGFVNKSIPDTSIETTIQGPQTGLSEDLETNLNIIRHRYHQSSLTIEDRVVGNKSQSGLKLLYDAKVVDGEVLKELYERLSEIDKDVIQSVSQLSRLITSHKSFLFPTIVITERPDRISDNLSKGKVIVIMEGTRFALVLPSVFYDFMSSMDDLYLPSWVAKFLVILRYLGLGTALLLPAIYVGITAFNPELFRVQLALSIAGSRMSVPYPAYMEVLFMLIMMELLTEASIRLPKAIGPTATTVGGLILGQAATEAGLVSNIMIIIVSAVAISNFVIPINEMGFAMRVTKYLLLAVATLSGLIGVIIGLIGIIYYLVSLNSFGRPYLAFFNGEQSKK
ncbi:spore germination protein [Bacillus sp. UMB0899]|uniref:spore germination protein n=1 Tax=Metabacillus schmidteae TaxID=2730405 RepID=UPI000C7F87C3|nr:spore germination protein [Metabacillus schmidteae]PMC35291.1 spore germination protein [Bacillus sp. UMB0899]